MATCPKCGKNIEHDGDYCPQCGAYIGAEKTAIMTSQTETTSQVPPMEEEPSIPFYKKKWGTGIIIAASALVLLCCVSSAIAGIYYFRGFGSQKEYQTKAKEFSEELKDGASDLDTAVKDATSQTDLDIVVERTAEQGNRAKKIQQDLQDMSVGDDDRDSYNKLKAALKDYIKYLDKLGDSSENPLNLELAEETGEIKDLAENAFQAFGDFFDASPFLEDRDNNIVTSGKNIISMLERTRKTICLSKIKVAPNPMSPNDDGTNDFTTISFEIPRSSIVTLKILDATGNEIKTLLDKQELPTVKQQVVWKGDDNLGKVLVNGTYSCKITAAFDNTSKTKTGAITVEGVTVACSACSGTGKVNCSTCQGGGVLACTKCGARGWLMCGDCEGSGTCLACGGEGGYYTEDGFYTCDNCGGSGSCPTCNGTAGVDCSKCGGDGKINCSSCGGSGKTNCSQCGGDGKL